MAVLLALIYLCTPAGPLVADNAAPGHYDPDGDGLIEVNVPEQLNAIRYDLDGDGVVEDDNSTEGVDEEAVYAAAFPVASDGSVCPDGTSCTGYELMADLDLDTDGDGRAGDGDTYWNDGAGWLPIGDLDAGFAATFDGNGRTISNLFIDRGAATGVGLFGLVDEGGEVRNVNLAGLSVTGEQYVGGLVGWLEEATLIGGSSAGSVTGSRGRIGGLVGHGQNAIIRDSWSSATVSETGAGGRGRIGGLVGELQTTGSEGGVQSAVQSSYATGVVSSGKTRVGGLVGNLHQQSTSSALVVASYAAGAVSGGGSVGGLVGRSSGEVRASYATGQVSGDAKVGGLVGDNRGTVTASYFDTDTSEQTHATQGKTTAELQAPTGYEVPAGNIYAQWNVDLDGDDTDDDPWDFGSNSQYPALKADGPDEDAAVTWQEFGSQLRVRPELTVRPAAASVTLTWTAPAAIDYPGMPSVTYQAYRDEAALGAAQAGVTYTDTGLAEGYSHVYRVEVLLDGAPARGSNTVAASPPPPTSGSISIEDAAGAEGGDVTFTVSKTGAAAASLDWTASTGESDTALTADLGATTSGAVAFAESDTSKTFSVATVQDAIDESDETFTVSITVTSGAISLADGTAIGTITDDDESAGAPTSLTASTGSGAGEVDLSWTAPSNTGVLNGVDPATITGYQYRRAESSAGLESATWNDAETATTLTVTDLTGGETYYFQVRALNGVTPEGAVSNEASGAAKTPSSNADLSSLAISQGTLSPNFTATETAYTATVGNSVESLTVTPKAADSNATVAVNDGAVASGSASGAIDLTVGANVIEVTVTAEDGTDKTYTITVTRCGPCMSIADSSAEEGDTLSFTVSKEGPGTASIDWDVSIAGSDTASLADLGTTVSGTIAFAEQDSGKVFTVDTVQDAVDETDETFTVTLTVASGPAAVTDGTAAGAITDDDESAGAPSGLMASTGSGAGRG